jgi:hypothetical protein
LLATQGEIIDENRYDDFLPPINIKMIAINAYITDLLKDSLKIFHCYMLRSGGQPRLHDNNSIINSSDVLSK